MSFSRLTEMLQGGVQTETALSDVREQIDALELHTSAEFEKLRESLAHAEVRLQGLEQSISRTLGVGSSEPGETIPLPFERRASPQFRNTVETTSTVLTVERVPSSRGKPRGHRDLANRGSRLRECGALEYRYDSNNYAAQARKLGVGTIETKRKRRTVWLTAGEVTLVQDAIRPAAERYYETRRRKRQIAAAAKAVAKLKQPKVIE